MARTKTRLRDTKQWAILTLDEQAALGLSYGEQKSSWQAGEVLGKSHYKYLELKARATHFLKMFAEYFQLFDSIIPPGIKLDSRFELYILKAIGKRKKINDIIRDVDDEDFMVTSFRNKLIVNEMDKLSKSKILGAEELFNLIKDFDRWNNFRILPPEIQEPTAYKRRNKHKNRKLIKQLYNINPVAFTHIVQKYDAEDATIKRQLRKVPMFHPKSKELYILNIKPLYVKDFTAMGVFVFASDIDCMKFHEIVSDYMKIEVKHCREGQHFWPMFRTLIKRAVNYQELQNLNPSRRLFDYAFPDRDLQLSQGI